MDGNTALLVLTIVTALAFDFTNGFHDTANAMATSVTTGALRPKVAVLVAAVLNFVGALLSLSVAATIAKGIVDPGAITLTVVFAGLVGGICWNLLTWLRGMPSSSSHALIGGVVGATIIADGMSAVNVDGLVSKVLIPAVLAPLAAGLVAVIGTFAVFRITRSLTTRTRDGGFRFGQIGSASLVALAHGTNDAQKTMGIITLALIANGTLNADAGVPMWVVISCATVIALGTYIGGWRIIRTVGKGLVDIEPTQGFTAQGSSAAVILTSSHFGFPLSTTQVCTGSVIGSGLGKKLADVRWGVARQMVTAWVFTLPAAGLVGGLSFWIANTIGGAAGVTVVAGATIAFSATVFMIARRTPITAENVNDEWVGGLVPVEHEAIVTATAKAA